MLLGESAWFQQIVLPSSSGSSSPRRVATWEDSMCYMVVGDKGGKGTGGGESVGVVVI